MEEEEVDNRLYKVIINEEEQYSIWPADKENPLGWLDTGEPGKYDTKQPRIGTKAECLAYIEEVWTDMRPKSLRLQMEAQGINF